MQQEEKVASNTSKLKAKIKWEMNKLSRKPERKEGRVKEEEGKAVHWEKLGWTPDVFDLLYNFPGLSCQVSLPFISLTRNSIYANKEMLSESALPLK